MSRKLAYRVFILSILTIGVVITPSDGYGWSFQKKADFSNVVFVGDSISAGFQNGGLSIEGQTHGYPAFIAEQAGFNIALPLLSEPGVPFKLVLIDTDPITIVQEKGPVDRINPEQQATNLAVPGQKVNDALFKRPFGDDPITTLLLGFPGIFTNTIKSQIEWAEELNPTFVFLWIGNNDVLQFATKGGTEAITPIDEFERDYLEILDRLEDTGADLVIGNIGDVTSIPVLLSAEDLAEEIGVDLAVLEPILGIANGDFITLEGLDKAEKILVGELEPILPDAVVLDASEVEEAQQAVDWINGFIDDEAYRRNIPVVDINLLFKFVQKFGIPANGKQLNTGFLGGLFSLDGVHPTNTGYAVIANHFIRTLNRCYRARIPRINIREIAENDPLVIPKLLPDTNDFRRNCSKVKIRGAIRLFIGIRVGDHEPMD